MPSSIFSRIHGASGHYGTHRADVTATGARIQNIAVSPVEVAASGCKQGHRGLFELPQRRRLDR